ncbi:MAG: PEP-CTERM sorting domain-containing protein [Verrucomicrobiota bacterium JB022]|nr:PEP-CTERM sorting domain-containing protein [Verrucomicrobiota bacterium JB022]
MSTTVLALLATQPAWGTVSITGGNFAYYEDFNDFETLDDLPEWTLRAAGASEDPMYLGLDDGSMNTGGAYSYGRTGSSERSFGFLPNNNLAASIIIEFRNDTSSVINEFFVSADAELWHGEASGSSTSLKFNYIVPGNDPLDRNYDGLDYHSGQAPINGAANPGPIDSVQLSDYAVDRPILPGETFLFEFFFPVASAGMDAQGIGFDNFVFAVGRFDGQPINYMENIAAVIPEPSTYAALAGAAALGLIALGRRRQ